MSEKAKNIYQGCYGSKAKPSKVKQWILKNVKENIKCSESNIPRYTLSIWGAPGTSKTSIVKQLESEQIEFNGKLQNVSVVDVPLAQIEEMGDVLGFPVEEVEVSDKSGTIRWIKAVDSIISMSIQSGENITGNKRTTYAPPAWVPTEEKPGVILFDDGNRASQRIMKGLMQLVQDYRTISWALPKGWTICFTGNPDNRYNQVTSMDSAQITRMKHITLECDAKEWASWASKNGIDERGINFILAYPEMIIGKERTNPRTLASFFSSTQEYNDLSNKDQIEDFIIDANASLDEETVNSIINFMTRDNEFVISPEIILNDPTTAEKEVKRLLEEKRNQKGEMIKQARTDIIAITMSRLVIYLTSNEYQFKKEHIENFEKWFLIKELPKDLVYATLSEIADSKFKYVTKFITGDNLTEMILDMYKKD